MESQHLIIKGIPALLWGPKSDHLFIAVHGDQSHKGDEVIKILAETTLPQGYQVLSFDLPDHGERQGMPPLCKPEGCVKELKELLLYAQQQAKDISLFGCSIGAYFSMLAFEAAPLRQALFLSPVVDMKRLIQAMMGWFNVSEAALEKEGKIHTPAKTLYWDYYQYVLAHPVHWSKRTALLYGEKDSLCEAKVVEDFARAAKADLTVMAEGEHFFHTEAQLAFYRRWLEQTIIPGTP